VVVVMVDKVINHNNKAMAIPLATFPYQEGSLVASNEKGK
jgi:hypothetical protein